ncbi:MAG: alpha,2-mannosyltransferase [Gaiellaceae bacterium]|nr:alpha,2-mannosyltransferase [Gaiellaceae bacterium]
MTWPGLRQAASRIGPTAVFALLPSLLLTVMLAGSVQHHFAFDFHQFWEGGRDVIEGNSPYPPASSLPQGGDRSLDPIAIQNTFLFPYPAPAAIAMVPFGALPFPVAAALFVLLSIAAVFGALRLLDVVDWRCYGLAFASIATLSAVRLGTFTPFLVLGLAVAWRFRNTKLVVATAVASLILLKLFLWPLLIWLVLSRRAGSAALTLAIVATAGLASWAVIGFAGLSSYPELLSTLAASVQGKGWSTVALGLSLGVSAGAAKLFTVVLAGAGLAVASRRDFWSFTVAIATAILMSPIVWLHYFLLLVVPLAIAFPALAPAWFIPLALWAWPFPETGGDIWKVVLGLAVLTAVCATTLLSSKRSTPASALKTAG